MLLKTNIADALKEQKKWLSKKHVSLKRDVLTSINLNPHMVLIITGIRRCGKSTLMHQLTNHIDENFNFFNFEDPRIFGFEAADFNRLNQVFDQNLSYYFFDEIQNVPQWEIFMRNLHDQEKIICITGSNAALLSRELGTRLTGRNLQLELYPFSYGEYIRFQKYKPDKKSLLKYLQQGGFPDYLKLKNKEVLQQLLKDVVYRDIVVRHGIRNDHAIMDIALFLISNVGKMYSLNSLKKSFNIGSASTVSDYLQWLEDSYLLFSLPRFSYSLKSLAVNAKKIYTIDPGFAHANSLSYSKDLGRLFENIIFLELKRKKYDLHYFREKGECDFVLSKNRSVTDLIQVCVEVSAENKDREVNGLLEAMNFFELNKGTILTMDQEDTLREDNKSIELLPAWKWLTIN